MQKITKEIRKFLWQGGKSNGSKKFHLVNWDVVCSPKNCGGVGTRDPTVMNLALGVKILWRIVSREKVWWKTWVILVLSLGFLVWVLTM